MTYLSTQLKKTGGVGQSAGVPDTTQKSKKVSKSGSTAEEAGGSGTSSAKVQSSAMTTEKDSTIRGNTVSGGGTKGKMSAPAAAVAAAASEVATKDGPSKAAIPTSSPVPPVQEKVAAVSFSILSWTLFKC